MNNKIKYRVLVVGCGTISHEWFPVLQKRSDCEICGVVDINPEAAKERTATYAVVCPIYEDYKIAIDELKPDVVVDLTFPKCHHDITVYALRAGCHVFGEKPMAMNREDALDMLKTAKETGKFYDVLQNRRFLNGVREMKEAIRKGMLGDIWMTCCEIYVNADLSGGRNSLTHPMLQDQAIHSFDTARFILGCDAATVYAHSYNPKGSPYNGDGSGACIFEMKDGSVLVFNAIMGTSFMKTAWHSQWRIIGNRGTMTWNGFEDHAVCELMKEDGTIERTTIEANWKGITWHEGAIDEMFTDLTAGVISEGSCYNNYGSVAMEFAALESVAAGAKVEVK